MSYFRVVTLPSRALPPQYYTNGHHRRPISPPLTEHFTYGTAQLHSFRDKFRTRHILGRRSWYNSRPVACSTRTCCVPTHPTAHSVIVASSTRMTSRAVITACRFTECCIAFILATFLHESGKSGNTTPRWHGCTQPTSFQRTPVAHMVPIHHAGDESRLVSPSCTGVVQSVCIGERHQFCCRHHAPFHDANDLSLCTRFQNFKPLSTSSFCV